MPFQSLSQMRTCYSLRSQGKNGKWDCDQWLQETPNVKCLPERKGDVPKKTGCRPIRKGEHVIGPVQTGPRGGNFFTADGIKVYVSGRKRKV